MQNNELFYSTISRFQRLYAKSLYNRLGIYGVRPGYLDILTALWQKDGITQKQLHAMLDIEQATLSNTLARMQRDEIIRRVPFKKDKRLKHIYLTDKGTSLEQSVHSAIEDLDTTVNNGLTINDRRYFRRILRQMTEQVEDDLVEPLLMLLDEVTDEHS